jgi:hypothetical protein
MCQLFYESEEPPKLRNLPKRAVSDDVAWGSSGKDADFLERFRSLLGKTSKNDRKMLMFMAQKMAVHRRVR